MSMLWVPPNGLWPHRWETVGWGAWDATSGATLTRTQNSAYLSGGVGENSAANADDGDTISWYVACDSGTYSLMVIDNPSTNRGIFTITLGPVTVAAAHDMYNNPFVANRVTTYTGIIVATPGVKELKFTTNGKNASSTDYAISIQLISLVRTGAP